MAKPVTIHDVAAAAAVSVTTVSHALNGRGHVRPATKQHVQAVAERLGYRPSRSAQNVRFGRTGALALVLPAAATGEDTSYLLAADFYMTVANVAARASFAEDLDLILLHARRAATVGRAPSVDGALVVDPVRNDPWLAHLESLGIPTVTIERDPARPKAEWWVAPDNEYNSTLALDHLVAAGGTKVALLSAAVDAGWVADVEVAYAAWCAARSQPPIVVRASLEHLVGSTHVAVQAMVARPDRPDALLATAELFGPAAVTALRDLGLAVPSGMLVASVADSSAARSSEPPLTAIDARPDRQAAAAVELLLRRIAGEPASHRAIRGALRARASTHRSG